MISTFRKVQGKVEKSNTIPREPLREASPKVVHLLNKYEEELPPSYKELSLISKKEFEKHKKENQLSRDHKIKVREGVPLSQ